MAVILNFVPGYVPSTILDFDPYVPPVDTGPSIDLVFQCPYTPNTALHFPYYDNWCALNTLGTLRFYHGEYSNVIQQNPRFDGYIYHGEVGGVEISTTPYFSGVFFHGEAAPTQLATYGNFESALTEHGEGLSAVVDIHPSLPIEQTYLSFKHGEYVVLPKLSTTAGLSFVELLGESLTPTLTTYEADLLETLGYIGETVVTSVRTTVIFSTVNGHGETSVGDFETFPAAEMLLNSSHGDNLATEFSANIQFNPLNNHGESASSSVEINPFDQLSPIGYHGESSDYLLSTSTTFNTLGQHGESSSTDFLDNPADHFDAPTYHGELLSHTLSTTTTLRANFTAHGELLISDLYLPPTPAMSLNSYFGDLVSTDFWVQQNLISAVSVGELVSTAGLVLTPHEYIFHGERLWAYISNNVLFSGTSWIGERVVTDFYRSEPLWVNVYGNHGEHVEAELKEQYAVNFWVVFGIGEAPSTDINSAKNFDLGPVLHSTYKKPYELSSALITMDYATAPHEVFIGGSTTRCSIELSARPRFSVSYAHGDNTYFADTVDYVTITFGHGEDTDAQLDNVYNWRLCPGNFIQDGSGVLIEMENFVYPTCISYSARHGELAKLQNFSVSKGLAANPQHGDRLHWALYLDPIIQTNFRHGDYTVWKEIALACNIYHGEDSDIRFEPDTFIGTHGDKVLCDIDTDVNVMFDEPLCVLQNDYHYQTEDGDEDYASYIPTAIEGYYFRHIIRVRCF